MSLEIEPGKNIGHNLLFLNQGDEPGEFDLKVRPMNGLFGDVTILTIKEDGTIKMNRKNNRETLERIGFKTDNFESIFGKTSSIVKIED